LIARRARFALPVALAVLAIPLQATAAPPGGGTGPGVVTKGDESGVFVQAVWENPATSTFGFVRAFDADIDGIAQIVVSLFTDIYDGEGNAVGYVLTNAVGDQLSSYGSLEADKFLTTAQMTATDVPGQTCTATFTSEEGDFEEVCEPVLLDAQAMFTGVGDLSREPLTLGGGGEGFVDVFHSIDTSREAQATGTVAGTAFTAEQTVFGSISRTKTGVLLVNADEVRPEHAGKPSPGEITASYVPDEETGGCTGTLVLDYTFDRVAETFALIPSILHQWEVGPDAIDRELFEQYTPLPESVTGGTFHFEVPVSISDGDLGTPDIIDVFVWHAFESDGGAVAPTVFYDVIESEGSCTLTPGDGVIGN
jgi:hypothetical protein